ncbi:MAG TPA: acylphosphatase [Thermoplasmatales archaeon]|nr:acylphosphatase [Thermoplasmatales archaeon]HEX17001.1 acylphosphatase [Thermoplasmatales archaeon]
MKVQAHVLISGRVQGVWFRANTKEKARQLNLKGWVRNLPDGRVEALFEGEKEMVEEMIKWCHKGPPLAEVEKVEVEYRDYEGKFDDFSILY